MPALLPATVLRWLSIPFVLVMAVMAVIGAPLKTDAAPHGIVTFELCAITADCSLILKTWSAPQREYAMLGLGLDYLYLILYPSVIAAALLHIAATLPERTKRAAAFVAWLLPVAGLADAMENFCLIKVLTTGQLEPFAQSSAVFASIKFAILALALVSLAAAVAFRLIKRRGDA